MPRARSWSTRAAVLMLVSCGRAPESNAAQQPAAAGPIAPTTKPPAVETLERGFADVAERVGPAVVKIEADRRSEPMAGLLAQASGVIVSSDGLILTNAHVIDGAETVQVTLSDERELHAKVVGKDDKSDIAVLDVDAADLPFLPLGDSDEVRVGDFVLAVGNPFGVGQTVTLGIVSATGRGHLGIIDDEDFIQTDAAINPGNSGGALVNTRGELVGIATAIVTGTRGNTGVGFAVPSKMTQLVMREVMEHGRVIRGWLGVEAQDVTKALAETMRLGTAKGALVADVVPGSPAARAGLRRGDVVTAVNGAPVEDGRDLRLTVGATKPGTKTTLTVMRQQRKRDVAVVLREQPEPEVEEEELPDEADEAQSTLGILVHPLTEELAEELEVPAGTSGVVVTAVSRGSRADDAGLRPGDIILQVDDEPVTTPIDLQQQVIGKEGPLLMLVMRDGATAFIVIEP